MRTDLEQRIYDRVNSEIVDTDFPSLDAFFAEFRRRMKEYVLQEYQKEFIARDAFDEAMQEVEAMRRQRSVPASSIVTKEQVMPASKPAVAPYIRGMQLSPMVAGILDNINSVQWEDRKSYRQVKTDMACPQCGSPLHAKSWPNGRVMLSCNIGAREKDCKFGTVLKQAESK